MAADRYDFQSICACPSQLCRATGNYAKGLYAVRVNGRIPPEIQDELDRRGITYRPRDSLQD